MRQFIRQLTHGIAIIIVLVMTPVHPDQNNPELDGLFARLHETSDTVEAAGISREIWENWYQSDNPEVTELMKLGEISMHRMKYDEAVEHYSQIIDIDPSFAEGWNRRATVYYLIGELELSTDDVTNTLNLEPRHFGALSGQGLIYMQQQNPDRALEYMERALEVNPHMIGVQRNIESIKKLIESEVI